MAVVPGLLNKIHWILVSLILSVQALKEHGRFTHCDCDFPTRPLGTRSDYCANTLVVI